jgi:hypothetical protein
LFNLAPADGKLIDGSPGHSRERGTGAEHVVIRGNRNFVKRVVDALFNPLDKARVVRGFLH